MEKAQVIGYGVFVGIDVGKSSNYVVALARDKEKPLVSREVPQDEAAIREVLDEASSHGRMLVTVDQCGAFGRLTVAVAKDMGFDVAHIPPRKFKQAADTYGEDKDDLLDAYIIADTACSTPRLVELVGDRPEVLAQIKVLSSARDDCVTERTRCYNRLHDLIHQVCPPLEAVFAKDKLHNDLEMRLLKQYGGPQGFRKAGKARCAKWAGNLKYQCTRGPERVEEVFEALSRQTVALPAAEVIEQQIKKLAKRVIELNEEEDSYNAQIEALSASVPEVGILRTMPGVGRVYGATIAAEIGDIARFKDSAHLATYAGLSPVRKKSGSSLDQKKKRKGGNRRLKNAIVQSSDKARSCEDWAEEYYQRKRGEGKKHRQALFALARRRVDAIYAMLSHGTFYEPRTKEA